MPASIKQLEFLIDKYGDEPDDALANKISEVVRELVDRAVISPKQGSEYMSSF